ncbi:transcriptional regulator [Xenorhabdus bovienii]|uniref:Transcriptional regulator n=1 Tax=Xenorhabdus bovienii str. Intermedium TaxID=1379677 RepID=A0A077QJS3_XENBV|nr:metalloregulator ArsR/SmtB family transcription factor [Xenorhabdus bovienii]MDE9453793.1 transcriptional regulator [Xenorhabdus bovienii]MDE9481709.1 transcriptional regulator [Xenorhabdus bovienii]MDE9544642.1 transcriptional regulator [Xenorhabdus bovienii]MDE9550782.1 transcriptional regulator [Xenorhabdus bovienii]MDE9554923.1 transcriptional regulator [Xenorhabdus bovienii]
MSSIDLENNIITAQTVSERLLMLLKTRGAMQASDVGKILGTSGEAARQQFVKLAKEGLVEAESETRGVGRPIQLWHLTDKGHARFPNTHAELTVQLLTIIRSQLGETAMDLIINTREQKTSANYKIAMEGAAELQEKIERLVAIRNQEGYMAQYSVQEDGAILFIENHCPICAAATMCQGFCRAELKLFREILQAEVERTEYILNGDRRCAYRIIPLK